MSLRNVVKRREHKERGQLQERKKLGLLEKHKDYVLRARDFNKKKDRLRKMQRKASFRNPDEFYFQMQHAKTEDGVHISEQNHAAPLTAEALKVLKTQDAAYLHMKRAVDQRKAERLAAKLHFLDAPAQNQHTVFVDSVSQVDSFDAATHFGTAPELVDHVANRVRNATLQSAVIAAPMDRKTMQAMAKKRDAEYRELGNRLARASQLRRMSDRLELERKVQAKGKKRKVQDAQNGAPAVYKWKQERQT